MNDGARSVLGVEALARKMTGPEQLAVRITPPTFTWLAFVCEYAVLATSMAVFPCAAHANCAVLAGTIHAMLTFVEDPKYARAVNTYVENGEGVNCKALAMVVPKDRSVPSTT